jgi:hypothetical protein
MSRVLIAALLALSLTGCSMWSEKHVNAWSSATAGEQFDRLLWDDVKNNRLRDLEPHLSSTFVATVPGGVRDRAGFLDYLKGLQVTEYSIADVKTAPAGGDIVVTYTISLRGAGPGATMTGMTVWQQVKKGYVAISHSEVPKAQ